jgi:hypothetical protein
VGPKQNAMMAWNDRWNWGLLFRYFIDVSQFNFIFIVKANLCSFSRSAELRVEISGQKKMLTPEGKSGASHSRSQF